MRDMCEVAAKGLLEHFTSGPARITDFGVYVPVDFRVDRLSAGSLLIHYEEGGNIRERQAARPACCLTE